MKNKISFPFLLGIITTLSGFIVYLLARIVSGYNHVTKNTPSQEDQTLHMENMFTNELSYISSAVSQIRSDISNTFYFYLVFATVLSAILAILIPLYFTLRQSNIVSPLAVETLIFLVLVGGGFLSGAFFQRINQLYLSHNDYIKRGRTIKNIYARNNVLLLTLEEKKALNIEGEDIEYVGEVPFYIRNTVFMGRSSCFAGATFIAVAFIIFRLVPSLISPSIPPFLTFFLMPKTLPSSVCLVSEMLCVVNPFIAYGIAATMGILILVILYFGSLSLSFLKQE